MSSDDFVVVAIETQEVQTQTILSVTMVTVDQY